MNRDEGRAQDEAGRVEVNQRPEGRARSAWRRYAKRRTAFLVAAIVLGVLELALLVAVRAGLFSSSPGMGLGAVLVILLFGWGLFILGPLWIRRVRPSAPRTLRDPRATTATVQETSPSYFGHAAIEAQWPWGIAAGCVIIGATIAGLAVLDRAAIVSAVLAGVGSGAFLWLDVWSWRSLGRSRARSAEAARVYRVGVLGFGLVAWIISTIWRASQAAGLMHGAPVFSLAFGFNLVWRALVYFPLCLWGGYVWARALGELGQGPHKP